MIEYTQFKPQARIPNIFTQIAPLRHWDVSGFLEENFLTEQFDAEPVIIVEVANTPMRLSNGILTYYEKDAHIARKFISDLVEEMKKKKKNKIILNPQPKDLELKEVTDSE